MDLKSENTGTCAGAAGTGAGLVLLGTSDTHGNEGYKKGDELLLPATKEFVQLKRLKRMRRGIMGISNAIQGTHMEQEQRFKVAMATLTYRPDVVWNRRHITNTIKCYREWARRRGIKLAYVWVLELTQRGVPHYHVLIWLPRGYTPPLPDKQGWWKHGHTQAAWARSPVGYIAKYASKGTNGQLLPKGARVWGYGGLDEKQKDLKSWIMCPNWLKPYIPFGQRVKRVAETKEKNKKRWKEWWWEHVATGNRFRSPWLCLGFKDGVLWLQYIGFNVQDVVLYNDPAG